MKYIFLGSGAIAKECLRQFFLKFSLEKAQLVGLVGTKDYLDLIPDWYPNLLESYIELSQSDKREEELISLIRKSKAEMVISVQYPWILSRDVINACNGQAVNIHNAKLPDYRGHNSLSHEILNRESLHVSTLHWIAEEVDRGSEIATLEVKIEDHDTAFSLWKKTIPLCIELFMFAIECNYNLENLPIALPQNAGKYYGKKSLEPLKIISQDATLTEIYLKARAFWFPPYEPAYFLIDGKKLYVTLDYK